MNKYLTIAIVICLVAVIAVIWKANQPTTADEPDEVVITLERTPCFGNCPVYKLTIQGDGTLNYEDRTYMYEEKDPVEAVFGVETTISRDKVKEIISEFEKAKYFSLNDRYMERTITDAETVITSITINGNTKTIEHYRGDFSAPKKLTKLEDRIDEIVNTSQWIK